MSAPSKQVLRFKGDGTIETIGVPPLPCIVITKRRISHILPRHPLKRAAFILLRRLFGEDGKVSGWTRSWSGPWTATMLIGNGEHFTHASRAECVRWEIEVANRILHKL